MPKVSVVVLTHNRPDMLCRAVSSILNQTFQDFEIVLVDDASTDNTPEVVRGLGDARIKYIRHKENRGEAAAANTGVTSSSGEYIAFLHDDDEWLPEKLGQQVRLLESSPPTVGAVYTGFLRIDRSTKKLLKQVNPQRGEISLPKWPVRTGLAHRLRSSCAGSVLKEWAYLTKLSLLERTTICGFASLRSLTLNISKSP